VNCLPGLMIVCLRADSALFQSWDDKISLGSRCQLKAFLVLLTILVPGQ
jgi:hypothetical protein